MTILLKKITGLYNLTFKFYSTILALIALALFFSFNNGVIENMICAACVHSQLQCYICAGGFPDVILVQKDDMM